MERDRWLTILAVLGTTALVGCERKDSPVTEVPAATESKDAEHSCGAGGCGSKDAEDEADAEAPEATADAAAPSDAAAPANAAAPSDAGASAEASAPAETAAAPAAPKPKAKAKPKKKKAKSSGEQACGEGTCA